MDPYRLWVALVGVGHRRLSPAFIRPERAATRAYPPDPPTVQEIIAVMRGAGNDPDAIRLRGAVVVLWRAGLRISEAVALTESDLHPSRGAVMVHRAKGGNRREVGTDR